MFEYIRQYSEYSFEIAPKQFPYKENITIYQGDEINISLRGIHLDDERSPFNFGFYDEFNACFKLFEESNEEYCSVSDNFVLGQSDKAIQYDTDNNNPPGHTQDELHFIDPDYSILKDYTFPKVVFDIQAKTSDSIYTFIKFNIKIKNEVTK